MTNYSVDSSLKWDYENGFYLTCETGRIGKFLNHLEIYKQIVDLPGDILEFGVYKGSSLVRLLSFRELLESNDARSVSAFDAFGKFPDSLSMDSDQEFVRNFETAGGQGISKEELTEHLGKKGFTNYSLIAGDIMVTLPEFILSKPSLRIALLHIDVDVYEPSKLILEALWDRVVKGGIVMLDDYGTVEGETRAVDEFFADKDVMIHKPKHYHIPSYIIKK